MIGDPTSGGGPKSPTPRGAGDHDRAEEDHEHVVDLAIADLSPVARPGFRGRDTVAWLNGLGFVVPSSARQAHRHADDHVVVALGDREVLILPPLTGRARDFWATVPAPGPDTLCRRTPRRDGSLWFRLTGRRSPTLIRAVAGIDATPAAFPDLTAAPVVIADHRGLLVRDDLTGVLAFHLLFVRAPASFLWMCLSNRIADMDGAAVNPDVLRGFSRS